jgi:hypothetical protein
LGYIDFKKHSSANWCMPRADVLIYQAAALSGKSSKQKLGRFACHRLWRDVRTDTGIGSVRCLGFTDKIRKISHRSPLLPFQAC